MSRQGFPVRGQYRERNTGKGSGNRIQKHGERLDDLESQVQRVSRNTLPSGFGLELTHEPYERPSCTNCVKCWVGICCMIFLITSLFVLLSLFNVI